MTALAASIFVVVRPSGLPDQRKALPSVEQGIVFERGTRPADQANSVPDVSDIRRPRRANMDLEAERDGFLNRPMDETYQRDARDWIWRAAGQNALLAFEFLRAHSGKPKSGFLAEKFAAALDTEEVFRYLEKAEGVLTIREREVMRQSAYTKLGASDPVEALRQLSNDGRLSEADKAAAMGYISVSMPRDRTTLELFWNYPDQTLTGNAMGTAMSYWAGEKPGEAAVWLSTHLDSPNEERLARSVMQKWVAKDLTAAAEWVNSLPAGVAKETGIIYVAQAAVPVDPEAGLKWVEQIKHPKWREVLTEQAQKLILQRAQNPPGQ